MSKRGVKLVVPHPETGEPISVDAATVENAAHEMDFANLLD